jgi:DNA-binding NarL/FixJ family response regulator
LIEDDEDIRALTRDVLELKADLKCVALFNSEEFIKSLPDLRVDIVPMDIGLLGLPGIECVQLCSANSSIT